MTRRRLAAVGLATVLGVLLPVQVAAAEESGRIVEVKRDGDALRIVFRADGLPDGVPPHPERGDQLRLGRDPAAHRPFAAEDPGPELGDRLPYPLAARRHGDGIDGRCHRLHLLPKFIP